MSPTAGSAKSKSPSQARVTSPRPIAVRTWLISPFRDSSQPQMMPAATSGMTCGRKRTVRDTVPSRPDRDPVDDARCDESERDRDEAEEEDEPEGIEERLDEVRLAEDRHVVRQPDPRRGADAVPAVERVLDGQGQRLQDEDPVHDEGRQHEQPADDGLPADPLSEGIRRACRRRASEADAAGITCLGLASSAASING